MQLPRCRCVQWPRAGDGAGHGAARRAHHQGRPQCFRRARGQDPGSENQSAGAGPQLYGVGEEIRRRVRVSEPAAQHSHVR